MERQQENKSGTTLKDAFIKWIGLFLVIVASFGVYFIVSEWSSIMSGISFMIRILRPVIYGAVIAYILNPLMKTYQKFLKNIVKKTLKKEITEKKSGIITGLSIFLSIITGIVLIVVLCWMIVPQLATSIASLVDILPGKVNEYYIIINNKIKGNKFLADKFQDGALSLTKYFENRINSELLPWLQSDLLPNINLIASELADGIMSIINILYNLFIGIIVAIYILASKDVFSAQSKKFAYGIFKKSYADVLIHYVRVSNDMFSGFITGKILDSAIIGVICFFFMNIMSMPYTVLISVIIGVTNLIPVFGPYIGLLPSMFLIVLVDPMQALYFLIMIAVLMQIDGNIIGPAILGESTGLSAFWVLFSILLFGGLYGIAGMLIGVPLFAVIYRIVKDIIEVNLKKKNLLPETESYYNLKTIREDENHKICYIQYSWSEKERKNMEQKKRRKEIGQKLKNGTKKITKKVAKKTH